MTMALLVTDSSDHKTISQTGGGLADSISGAGTTVNIFEPGYRGSEAGTEFHATVSAAARKEFIVTAQTKVVTRIHINPMAAYPTSNATLFSHLVGGATGGVLRLSSAGMLQFSANGSSGFTNAQTLALNTVYWVEFQLDVSANPWIMRCRVNGTQFADNNNAVAANTITRFRPGTTSVTGPDYVFRTDNMACYSYTVDTEWIGDGRVWFLPAAFTPGHNVGTDTFRVTNDNGGTFTTLVNGEETSYDAINNWPLLADGNAAASWVDNTAGTDTTKYAAWYARNFPPPTVVPRGVNAIVALRASASGGTENFDIRLASGASESATKIFSGAIASTTTSYKRMPFPLAPDGAAWTAQKLRGAMIRWYAGNAYTQVPRIRGVALEVDAPLDTVVAKAFNDHPNSNTYYGASGSAARIELFNKLAAHGVTDLRADFRWDGSEPTTKGTYDSAYDARIADTISLAAAHGINILANTLGTPHWASGTLSADDPPTNLNDYADWLVRMVTTYPTVSGWEVWNEQNVLTGSRFWTGTQTQFISMLQIAYRAVRKANPQTLIYCGGTAQCDPTWWTNAYGLGLKGYTDGILVHNYGTHSDFPPEQTTGATQYFNDPPLVRAVAISNGDFIPVISGEYGWSSHADSTHRNGYASFCSANTANENQGVSEATQADYYLRSLAYARANFVDADGFCWMPRAYYYLFRNKDVDPSCAHTDMRGFYKINSNPDSTLVAKPIALADLGILPKPVVWGSIQI